MCRFGYTSVKNKSVLTAVQRNSRLIVLNFRLQRFKNRFFLYTADLIRQHHTFFGYSFNISILYDFTLSEGLFLLIFFQPFQKCNITYIKQLNICIFCNVQYLFRYSRYLYIYRLRLFFLSPILSITVSTNFRITSRYTHPSLTKNQVT